jgi:acid phosphatase type 7
MTGSRFRAAVIVGAAASALVFAAGANAQNQNSNNNGWPFGSPSQNNNTFPYASTGRLPVLAVVGDIACQPDETTPTGEANKELCNNPKSPYSTSSLWQSQEATANQIETIKPDLIALLGDLQYQTGQYSDFQNSFDLTYGAFKFLERPAPGNHEFYDEHSQTGVAGYGYFSYFNGFQIDANGNILTTTITDPCPPAQAAGCNYPGLTTPIPQPIPRADGQAGHFESQAGVADGWYSYNLGSWHIISLNVECSTQPGGCSTNGSWFASELAWLKKDLQSNHSACTVAYWHQPAFSPTNGIAPEGVASVAFWQLLYDYNADLVLNGHDHLYAHYRPLDPAGNSDPRRGIREFVVGTGGETLDPVVTATVTTGTGETNMEDPTGNPNFNALNLEAGSTGNYWGVMSLTLEPNGYKWDFESALLAPVAPAGSPATFSDKGSGTCHGPAYGW